MNTLRLETPSLRINYFLNNNPLINIVFDDIKEIEKLELTDPTTLTYNQPINNLIEINDFFRTINANLEIGSSFKGSFVDCVEQANQKKLYRIPILGKIAQAVCFVTHRVIPKTKGLTKLYFAITKGHNRFLSRAEVLGRLVYCGFEIIDVSVVDKKTHFVVRKIKEPLHVSSVSEGWVYKMPRIGRNGKMIHVYKLRTMHPYSEFLQDYLKKTHGYGANGKMANDFRITSWGKVLRKYWLDEIPQLINLIKGDMKVVGVRPISRSYFNDIPKDLQQLRLKQKPGCIPPYVALNRASSVTSVLAAEKEYLRISTLHPYTTDIKYIFLAVYNIIFKNKRGA